MKFNSRKLRIVLLLFAAFIVNIGFAQQKTITGTVKASDTEESLIGVSVVVKGTTNGTITDVDGNFSLSTAMGETLIISYIGYENKEIIIGEQTSFEIALEPSTEDLEEVVIIGYGQVKKEDATGSVSAVTSEDFNQGSITSPQELVSGKIAGVQITSGGGAPGSGQTIRIRGGSSLSASNDPLIVIDGVPVDNESVSGMRNPLNVINPNDIETFTVLKDASATAIYGSRASNGVIIITTKKGKLGSPLKISYNGKASVGFRSGAIDVLSADQLRNEVSKLPTSEAASALLGNANTVWQDEIFQPATGTDHNISLSGAANQLPYRASLGYSNHNGLLKTSSMERFTGSIGLNPVLFDNHLKVNVNLKGVYLNNRFADEAAIGDAIGFDPTQPVKVEESPYGGFFTWTSPNGEPNTVAPTNPVARLEMREDISTVMRSIGNLQFDYKFHFLPELRANLNAGYDYSASEGTVFIPENAPWMFNSQDGGGEDREYTQDKQNELLDFYLNYKKNINSSNIDAMLGYSWQHFYVEDYEYSTNVAGTRDITPKNTDKSEYYLVSFFGRVNYSLLDRYLITLTLRQDGTSRFSEDTRWGLFPAAAFAWRIDQESFMQNIDAVSNLKLRLGYGVTGQQNIGLGDYPYLARYTTSLDNAAYQMGEDYVNTLRPDGYDANIKWEETTTYNIGLDYGFYNNRLSGTIDIYQRNTKDLLNVIPVPAGTNFTNELLTNVGNLTNKGFEFAINGKPISEKDYFWEIGANFTYNQNEITKLTVSDDPSYPGVETGGISGGVGNNIQMHSVGQPTSSYYVYEQVYTPEGDPIEGVFVDQDLDGQITVEDRKHYKKPAADMFIGFNSLFAYKNFDVSFAGRININNYVYNNVDSRMGIYDDIYWSSGYLRNVTTDIYNTGFVSPSYFSDYYVQNASFLRLDHITLGYTFDKVFNEKSSLKVYGSVQNAFVVTPYKGLDPEVDGGIDNNVYPRPTTFTLGVNVKF